MELRRIRYFVAVAEELHFGRAAANLGIAQPALSLQINALESEMGIKLLHRSTRRVELTEAGRIFHQKAHAILNQVDDVGSIMKATAGQLTGRLNIGVIYPATFRLLPYYLQLIGDAFPGILPNIRTGTSEGISGEIERGNIHVGFIRRIEKASALRYLNISTDNYLLAIPKTNPLSQKQHLTLGDLRRQKIIGFENLDIGYVESYFKGKFARHGLENNIAFTCRNTLSMMALVTAGFGVGFLPEWAADFPNRDFVLREVEDIDIRISLGLVWRKDDPIANRDEMIEVAQALVASRIRH